MTLLSTIITPSNVLTTENTPDALTATNTKTVSNKTISGASNTISNLDASNLSSGTVATARLASGTADSTTYLRGDQTWAQVGLQYFTETEDATGVNASVPVDALIVANAGTNVDVALSPKGTGAVLAQIPDGTTTGGNKRGIYAVDWQTRRNSNTYVASGGYAVVSGGYDNRATSSYSTVVGGRQNNASNSYATAGGYANTSSGQYATAFTYLNTAIGSYSVAMGSGCVADGSYSTALGGYSDTRSRYSNLVIGCLGTANGILGTSQASLMQVGANTTDATPTVLTGFTNVTSYIYQNRMDLNSAYAFKIMLIAGVTGAGDTKAWELTGCIKRGSGVPTLVGAVTKTVIAADTGAATWDCDIVIDTDAFTVQAIGQAATTIRWSASIYSSELEF